MNQTEFKWRTKSFAIQVLNLVDSLPRSLATDVIARQLVRSATSVGANYRAACRAKSPADFIAKMGIVEEEADESIFWMELLVDTGKIQQDARLERLMREGNEIVAMTVSSIRTARQNNPALNGRKNPQSEIRNPQ